MFYRESLALGFFGRFVGSSVERRNFLTLHEDRV